MGLKYLTDDGVSKFALFSKNKVINSTLIKYGDRFYHNKVCDALDDLEYAQFKSFQWGHSCHIFTDIIHKYCNDGVQPN